MHQLADIVASLNPMSLPKAEGVLSFPGITHHYTTDMCLCIMTRDQQPSAQI